MSFEFDGMSFQFCIDKNPGRIFINSGNYNKSKSITAEGHHIEAVGRDLIMLLHLSCVASLQNSLYSCSVIAIEAIKKNIERKGFHLIRHDCSKDGRRHEIRITKKEEG